MVGRKLKCHNTLLVKYSHFLSSLALVHFDEIPNSARVGSDSFCKLVSCFLVGRRPGVPCAQYFVMLFSVLYAFKQHPTIVLQT